MDYPQKRTYALYLTYRSRWKLKKTIKLIIPQATIADISEYQKLSDRDIAAWLTRKIAVWWAKREAMRIVDQCGPKLIDLLQKTFFSTRPKDTLPESVLKLADKKGIYDYEQSDATIFALIASEYQIEPRELIKYTLDELHYLLLGIQYKNLNEEQKKELERIKKKKDLAERHEETQRELALLDNQQ